MTTQPDYWDAMGRDELVAKFRGSVEPQPDQNQNELVRLDLPAAIERALWAAYFDGQKEAKRLGGSNRVILQEKKCLEQVIVAHQQAAIDQAVAEIRVNMAQWLNVWLVTHDKAPADKRRISIDSGDVLKLQANLLAELAALTTPKERKARVS